MIGEIIYVHRRMSIVEAFSMVFEYITTSKRKNAEADLRKTFPDAFEEAEIKLADGGDLLLLVFQIISVTSPQKLILTWLFRNIRKNLPTKQAEVFILAILFGYRHYGIEVPAFNVVHFTGSNSNLGKDAKIVRTSRKDFLADGKLSVDLLIEPKFSPTEVADRALGLVGQDFGGYDAFENNCEHFTTWCATGSLDSRQGMWWNERMGPIEGHWERLKDFLWDLIGEQASRLRKKADADEKYSAELIEILVEKRIEFEARLNERTGNFKSDFYQLDHKISSCLAKEDYDGTRQNLLAMARLFRVRLKNVDFEEFTEKMEDDETPLII